MSAGRHVQSLRRLSPQRRSTDNMPTPMRFCPSVIFILSLPTGIVSPLRAAPSPDGNTRVVEPGGHGGSTERVVHRFDFNERVIGNLEEVPKYWEPLRLRGFPVFASGAFDESVGHAAPPSFYLSSEGRNVAFLYGGSDTRVRAGGAFRIVGHIRPDALQRGRACLSAHFLDREGRPLVDTLMRSAYVGGPDSSRDWTAVEVLLPPVPPEAHTIAIGAWVLQQATWDLGPTPRRHITHADVRGGAWFDDITLFRLPFVEFSSTAAGNVFVQGEDHALSAVLVDDEGSELSGEITIDDSQGRRMARHAAPATTDRAAAPFRIPIGTLPPGLYHSRLDVRLDSEVIDSLTADFAVLSPDRTGGEGLARSFGVVLAGPRGDADAELALLIGQGIRCVKWPVWQEADEPAAPVDPRDSERFLHELHRRGFAVTAVLSGAPSPIVGGAEGSAVGLLEVLKASSGSWADELAAVATPYAGVFRWWQIGADGSFHADGGADFAAAVGNVRGVLGRFITAPRLSAAGRLGVAIDEAKLPVEHLSAAVGYEVGLPGYAAEMSLLRGRGYSQVSAYVAPLPEGGFVRTARLAEWAQRVVAARHAGADTVYVPQTWHVGDASGRPAVDPREEFIVFRTIAQALGDAEPGGTLYVDDGVRCLAFHRPDSTILALWDELAPPAGRVHAVQLGRANRQTDLWGRSQTLERDENGRQLVRLSYAPVFVDGVDRWLVPFVNSAAIEPARVESGSDVVRHSIKFHGGATGGLSGQGTLEVPNQMEVTPRVFSFHAPPDRTESIEFTVRYAHTEPAGRKRIVAKMTAGPEAYGFELPFFVELGLSDMDVSAVAFVEGGDLVLRHVVGNRSREVLSFRASAGVPGRERQYRPIANLRPGDTQTLEYRFHEATGLIGRRVRLMLHELADGPRVHTLELTVP